MKNVIKFRGKNKEVFIEALKNPPPANPRLVEALKRYKKTLKSDKKG